ncbi:hypothetical protein Tco_0296291 [Tanacetum coccineum]
MFESVFVCDLSAVKTNIILSVWYTFATTHGMMATTLKRDPKQLRLVLSTEDKENYLEHPIPVAPVAQPGHQVPPEALAAHAAWVKGQKEVVEEGQSVSSYVLKMKGYIDNLERLGQPVGQNLPIVNELHAMLKLHEETLPKKDANPELHAIRAGRVQKK